MTWILLLCVAEVSLLAYALLSPGPFRIRDLIAINMVLISLFASKLLTVFGYTTNVANIFYATVVLSQAVIFHRYGKDAAVRTISMTMHALVASLSLSYIISNFPVVLGNEAPSQAIFLVANQSIHVVFASLFAFMIGQYTLVLSLQYLKRLKYPLAIILTQIVDSLVFFPIAFSSMPVPLMLQVMSTGAIFKVLVTGIMYLPLSFFI